jgi:hypothetical protein
LVKAKQISVQLTIDVRDYRSPLAGYGNTREEQVGAKLASGFAAKVVA